MQGPIRIVIVEDSSVVSMLLKAFIDNEPDMEVVGVAKDGREGVALVTQLRPDLVTMDIRMPVMDGFEATQEIMATVPTPIVVISSSVDDEELQITFNAINAGALSVLEKPHGPGHPQFDQDRRNVVEMVRVMSEVRVVRHNRGGPMPTAREDGEALPTAFTVDQPRSTPVTPSPSQPRQTPATPANYLHTNPLEGGVGGAIPRKNKTPYEVVAVGASTGGPQALNSIFSQLTDGFPLPILVVQHISPGFVSGLARWLNDNSTLTVKIAEAGETLHPGVIYLSRDGHHLGLSRNLSGRLCIDYQDEPQGLHRPAANELFRSVADVCGPMSIGILLTGMGEDGAPGLLQMKQRLAYTICQEPSTCVVAGMPQSAISRGAAKEVIPLEQIAPRLTQELGALRLMVQSQKRMSV
uniref:Protein-glutamate methylesterase/protein-glutamine glutaminase n=1 Tax=Magnetococcus massalia (strain MO-1) TaxID=451514 RepID=A0A1S7LHC0_MAGMO|nr:Chemotaxis response regulator protein-glutamate methylesterase [Candidatus Magnetococcus massalia]